MMIALFLGLIGTWNDEQSTHDAAHAGVSYSLTHLSEKICEKIYHQGLVCDLTAISFSTSAGLAKEYLIDTKESNDKHLRALSFDALGIGTALFFIHF